MVMGILLEPSVDGVESVALDALLGIGTPASRSPEAAHNASGSTQAPGGECEHRVRFVSVRRSVPPLATIFDLHGRGGAR
ncbi:hypothetical protein B8W66_18105 [Mycobacterium decipiens]|uniref:Uncharacterized protein n=1 Tax=Mycobacterium decipiens TaxID=1430326 RepID=A0A1X2LRB7_9MYCO|nr:hypothetical protein B8W66_18105 [Mycobacterium decipiens]